MNWKLRIEQGGILIATTIGAGIFALPWFIVHIGWAGFVLLLAGLTAVVASAELLYWRTLDEEEGRSRLIGLARRHLGKFGGVLAAIGVLGGLLAGLVLFLILGARFLNFNVPIPGRDAVLIFWVLSAWPALLGIRQFAKMETLGSIAKCLLILATFLMLRFLPAYPIPAFGPAGAAGFFAAFGAVLFALSGWNAVEPMAALAPAGARSARSGRGVVWGALSITAGLYLVFALGLGGSAPGGTIAPDGIGSFGSSHWYSFFLAVFGLIAVWSAYSPVAVELQNALSADCGVPASMARTLVLLAPPLLVLGGVHDILTVLAVGGGVFVAMQYLAILLVGLRALKLRPSAKFLAIAGVAVFTLAAALQLYALAR